jgi:hypothetical protein
LDDMEESTEGCQDDEWDQLINYNHQ